MGDSKFKMHELAAHTAYVSTQTQAQIFRNTTGTAPALDPSKFKVRESVDSPSNPNSTPIIIAVDETGSMDILAENIIRQDLAVVVKGLYDNKPVTDPHILLAVVGDARCDTSAIQTTQFEASIVLMEQAKDFYLEQNGGGNGGESYALVWAFAANKVKADCITKRHKKGYIFTVGDERTHMVITREECRTFLGMTTETDIQVKDLLEQVKQHWNVFHLIVRTASTHSQHAEKAWKELLGDHAVLLETHSNIGEMITALIQLNEGGSVDDVAKNWDPIAAANVQKALSGMHGNGRKLEV